MQYIYIQEYQGKKDPSQNIDYDPNEDAKTSIKPFLRLDPVSYLIVLFSLKTMKKGFTSIEDHNE